MDMLVLGTGMLLGVACLLLGIYVGRVTSPQPRRRERKPKPPVV